MTETHGEMCDQIEVELLSAMRTLATMKNSFVQLPAAPAEWANESLSDVMNERRRQIDIGHTREHDDKHADGSLVSFVTSILGTIERSDQEYWVWDAFVKLNRKRLPPRQMLVIAAAVLIAEIERRDRITMRLPSTDELEIVPLAAGSTS